MSDFKLIYLDFKGLYYLITNIRDNTLAKGMALLPIFRWIHKPKHLL